MNVGSNGGLERSKSLVPILMVDDDKFYISAYAQMNKRLQLSQPFLFANDGADALDTLRNRKAEPAIAPAIVMLLDFHMPRMNGLELLEEIGKDETLNKVKVFMHTACSNPVELAKMEAFPIVEFVQKSMSRKHLEITLRRLHQFAENL